MEIPVEQRQCFQQIKDEVEAIRSEVAELRSRSVTPVHSPSSSDISDGASSLAQPRQVPDLNSPPPPHEEAQDDPKAF
jgi:hypothetical protein